ncbi:RagB/SusD family nutrient uptake outer membrane protein [Pedobacter africanus]|uniref:SusD family protein n=1 Tax=Pedobacter africanus TaxID=151894 RepID=A0A1W2DM73_9SPHI|nr:RagB/SusD family nutrient uptake outer membrane protein [Pedobacter africanus]SMC98116.1 SusD family protein [Pedobacter africanus]
MNIKYRFFIKLLPVMAVTCIFTSCKKFLEEAPNKTTSLVVKTTAQINALLDNPNTFYTENNSSQIFSTDDYGLTTDVYNGGRGVFSNMAAFEFLTWDTQYIPDLSDLFWTNEYKKIFTANLALNSVDGVTGTEAEKAIIKADAHFIRAYSYWVLANTYCLPYTEQNKNEMGLPIKLSVSFEEPMQRQSLEKVYLQIEADLAEALKTPVGLMQSGRPRHWRASKAGVNAFAARYYLNRNNNAKAIEHANAALADYSTLVDYNTEMKYSDKTQSITINSGTPNAQTVVLKYPYTHDNQTDMIDMIGWKEFLYYRMLNYTSWWYIPSLDLLNLYDKTNDLRYEYHMVEGYSYDRGMTKPSYNYPGYIFFFKDRLPSGPTVAEVLLIKAEAQARSNDPGGAMTTINTLRAKRMKPGAWVNLVATGKDDAIKKVLEERRREMPFVQRWFDIRRYNNNDDPNDDVLLTRTFYPYNASSVLFNEPVKTYTLPKNSRRFAAPIPRTEIISSNGAIEQNTY